MEVLSLPLFFATWNPLAALHLWMGNTSSPLTRVSSSPFSYALISKVNLLATDLIPTGFSCMSQEGQQSKKRTDIKKNPQQQSASYLNLTEGHVTNSAMLRIVHFEGSMMTVIYKPRHRSHLRRHRTLPPLPPFCIYSCSIFFWHIWLKCQLFVCCNIPSNRPLTLIHTDGVIVR